MKKTGMFLMIGGGGLTLLFLAIWIAGFFFGFASIGGLIHLALVLSIPTFLTALVGLVLFIVGLVSSKGPK
jgi:lipopolysaccharide export LptBFGC system permease protein LptF